MFEVVQGAVRGNVICKKSRRSGRSSSLTLVLLQSSTYTTFESEYKQPRASEHTINVSKSACTTSSVLVADAISEVNCL